MTYPCVGCGGVAGTGTGTDTDTLLPRPTTLAAPRWTVPAPPQVITPPFVVEEEEEEPAEPTEPFEITTRHKVGAVLAAATSIAGTSLSFVAAARTGRRGGVMAPIFWGSMVLLGTGLTVGIIVKTTGLNRDVLNAWAARSNLGALPRYSLRGLGALQRYPKHPQYPKLPARRF